MHAPPALPALVQAATPICFQTSIWAVATAHFFPVARAPRAPMRVRLRWLLGPLDWWPLFSLPTPPCPARPNSSPPIAPSARSRQQHVVGHPGQPARRQGGPPAAARVRLRPAAQLCRHYLRRAPWGHQRRLQGVLSPLPPLPRLVHKEHPLARGAAAAGGFPAAKGSLHSHAAHAPRAAGPASRAGGGGGTAAGRLSRHRARLTAGAQRQASGTATCTIFCKSLPLSP